mmetsp:Transcript_9782/g.19953  ORF Transcript_9782/g.19953 Transcript_9782/m.19953 type:complete len:142 (-) Transcript_9782:101-526(-)
MHKIIRSMFLSQVFLSQIFSREMVDSSLRDAIVQVLSVASFVSFTWRANGVVHGGSDGSSGTAARPDGRLDDAVNAGHLGKKRTFTGTLNCVPSLHRRRYTECRSFPVHQSRYITRLGSCYSRGVHAFTKQQSLVDVSTSS